jgi:hypothetical protein
VPRQKRQRRFAHERRLLLQFSHCVMASQTGVLCLVEGGLLRCGRADGDDLETPLVQAACPVLKVGQQTSVRHVFSSAVS